MNCDFCGNGIFIGDEYVHFPIHDLNYHIDCVPKDNQILKREKRYREE